ncbi:hypothetical protein SK128_018715, partial [Halocaridina rubra]
METDNVFINHLKPGKLPEVPCVNTQRFPDIVCVPQSDSQPSSNSLSDVLYSDTMDHPMLSGSVANMSDTCVPTDS